MQGGSILAVSKVLETDVARSSGLAGVASNHNAFRNCLKRQSEQMQGPHTDEATTSIRLSDSKSGKLDRSALLRSASLSVSHETKNNTQDDSPDTEQINPDTSVQTIGSIVSSQNAAESSAIDDNGSSTGQSTDQVNNVSADNQAETPVPTDGPLEPLRDQAAQTVVPLPASAAVNPDIVTTDSIDPDLTVSAMIDSSTAEEPGSAQNTAEVLQPVPTDGSNIVITLDMEAMPAASQSGQPSDLSAPAEPQPKPMPEQAMTIVPLVAASTVEGSDKNVPAPPVTTVSADKTSLKVDSSDVAKQDTPALNTGAAENIQPIAAAQGLTVSVDPPVAAGDETASPQTGENQAAVQAAANNTAAVVPAKSDASTKVKVKNDPEGNCKTAVVSTATTESLKKAVEAIDALAGKLEQSAAKNTNTAEKKDATSPDLKKLMEFENNRLQAANLTGHSNESSSSAKPETQAAVNLNQIADLLSTKASTKTLSELTARTPIDVKNLVDQMVQKAQLVVKSGSSEMQIQLEPEFMGKMTIKVAMEDGLLTARFITDNHNVKHMLDNNLATLRQSLESQGIKVEKTEVNVQLDSGGTFGGYQEGQQEMWQRSETSNYHAGNGLDNNGYQLANDEELLQTAFVETELYGIQADGSLNFVV